MTLVICYSMTLTALKQNRLQPIHHAKHQMEWISVKWDSQAKWDLLVTVRKKCIVNTIHLWSFKTCAETWHLWKMQLAPPYCQHNWKMDFSLPLSNLFFNVCCTSADMFMTYCSYKRTNWLLINHHVVIPQGSTSFSINTSVMVNILTDFNRG